MASGDIPLSMGQTFWHSPQSVHRIVSTRGYKNPSASFSMVMHPRGQAVAHAVQPQHAARVCILIIFFSVNRLFHCYRTCASRRRISVTIVSM